jgi:hypothetical protein
MVENHGALKGKAMKMGKEQDENFLVEQAVTQGSSLGHDGQEIRLAVHYYQRPNSYLSLFLKL